MVGGWANSPGGWAPPNHALPWIRHYVSVSVNTNVGTVSATSADSVSVVTASVNTNVGATSATSADSVSVVTDSVNTVVSVASALSALTAVTSLSVFQCFH
jgi:hypothetical protein